MKKQTLVFAILLSFLSTLTGCEIIGGIFQTGMGVGIFIAVLVVAIIVFLISKLRGNK